MAAGLLLVILAVLGLLGVVVIVALIMWVVGRSQQPPTQVESAEGPAAPR